MSLTMTSPRSERERRKPSRSASTLATSCQTSNNNSNIEDISWLSHATGTSRTRSLCVDVTMERCRERSRMATTTPTICAS
ncbi:uncharacterized protein BO87DRAFT_115707 [Aspergillus neoniger CBS 115656]|uniref:Uncharacterized protein n=1 Tax=Aspergillus neoniger (strain CBS 115656) TaxID=1448310 RepID=A0A318YH57_ASPNB|nr:hypothetical protein BO87DRAFT_115707 [Aspergillus neoniger CBS 115656]PYH31900.1 hypothetical protein BO87DRAFT_115707 [Aspergillus neoniger CBS 115656]